MAKNRAMHKWDLHQGLEILMSMLPHHQGSHLLCREPEDDSEWEYKTSKRQTNIENIKSDSCWEKSASWRQGEVLPRLGIGLHSWCECWWKSHWSCMPWCGETIVGLDVDLWSRRRCGWDIRPSWPPVDDSSPVLPHLLSHHHSRTKSSGCRVHGCPSFQQAGQSSKVNLARATTF